MTRIELIQFVQDVGAEAVAKGLIQDGPPSTEEMTQAMIDDPELGVLADLFASKLQRVE